MKQRKQKGITLIALVLTTVVLLILVGISISLVVGKNGVVEQSNNAIVTNRKSSAIEDVQMAWTSAKTKYWTEWAQNSSKKIDDYFKMSVLNPYLVGKGEITAEPSYNESRGAYLVKYTAIDQNQPYEFYVTEDGIITERIGFSIPDSLSLRIKDGTPETVTVTAEVSGKSGNVTWSVPEGASNIELSATTGREITVTPLTEGNAKLVASCGMESVECDVTISNVSKRRVTFYANYGRFNGISGDNAYVEGYSGDIVDIPIPTRNGYIFMGWYTGSSSGDLVYDRDALTGELTEFGWLSARWWEDGYFGCPLNVDKYGWKVNGYSAKTGKEANSGSYTGIWRLFFQDSNNTYIIANVRFDLLPWKRR